MSWEDFLDLSKWRAPVTRAVLERRLFDLVNEALIIQQQTKAREEQKNLVSSKKPGLDDGLDSEEREDVVTFTHYTPNSPSRDELLRAAASKRIWNQQKLAAATSSSSSSSSMPYFDICLGDGFHDKSPSSQSKRFNMII